MQSRNWIPALMLGGLFALQSTASNAQEAIGKATSVKPQAEGSHGGNAFRWFQTFIRRRRSVRAVVVRLICDFTIAAILVWDQNRASGSISSCTTRINLPVPLLSKRHAARFDL